jgi:hypothetical protein
MPKPDIRSHSAVYVTQRLHGSISLRVVSKFPCWYLVLLRREYISQSSHRVCRQFSRKFQSWTSSVRYSTPPCSPTTISTTSAAPVRGRTTISSRPNNVHVADKEDRDVAGFFSLIDKVAHIAKSPRRTNIIKRDAYSCPLESYVFPEIYYCTDFEFVTIVNDNKWIHCLLYLYFRRAFITA